ncbi:metallophosphoesterase family protein [Bacillus horti]|uniref:3',5'-cyclic AMP phosphodiesterase CpdA n=1 Tax=Caldalkalibacillus horti TaxID=77523 RepID=A0ABT9VY46_9BACI|nr:metallophosphoesterase [Bacillus horti]MDQ0165901.1 3',5'-cyclic AMP phosphodiesterase CpdA [Bacillus horti]
MLRLVLIGDLHYPHVEEPSPEFIQAREMFYSTFLREYLAQEADWHISIGDLTNLGRPDELDYIYNHIYESHRQFRHVLGNHDAYALPKVQLLEITKQPRYNAIETPEAHLVFLDSTREMDYDDWGGVLDAEQMSWLEQQVEMSGEKPLLVFAHHPIFETTTRSELDKGSIHPDYDIQSILAKKKGKGFYFCGHNHAHSIVEKEQWHYIQTAACLDQPGFRIIEVSKNEFSTHIVPLTDMTAISATSIIYSEMDHFTHTPNAQGQIYDQSLIYKLETDKKEVIR